MNKYKIIALLGPAGSGKDYILSRLFETIYGKIHLHKIITSTTRPPRVYEKQNVHYHFLTIQQFKNKQWIQSQCFNNWWYGTSIDDLKEDKINIGVFSPRAINQILQKQNIQCIPIMIHCSDKIRLLRQLSRQSSPDCSEICRRFFTDKEDFRNLPFSYKVILNETNQIQPIISDLIHIIRQEQN